MDDLDGVTVSNRNHPWRRRRNIRHGMLRFDRVFTGSDEKVPEVIWCNGIKFAVIDEEKGCSWWIVCRVSGFYSWSGCDLGDWTSSVLIYEQESRTFDKIDEICTLQGRAGIDDNRRKLFHSSHCSGNRALKLNIRLRFVSFREKNCRKYFLREMLTATVAASQEGCAYKRIYFDDMARRRNKYGTIESFAGEKINGNYIDKHISSMCFSVYDSSKTRAHWETLQGAEGCFYDAPSPEWMNDFLCTGGFLGPPPPFRLSSSFNCSAGGSCFSWFIDEQRNPFQLISFTPVKIGIICCVAKREESQKLQPK